MGSDTRIFKLQVLENPLRGLVTGFFWDFWLTERLPCGSAVQIPMPVKGLCKRSAACPASHHTTRLSHKPFPRKISHLARANKNYMTCGTSQAHGDHFLDSRKLWLWPIEWGPEGYQRCRM